MQQPHPSSATSFDWDDPDAENGNVAKLARRKIRPQDVEAVWGNAPSYKRNKKAGTATWLMTGRDDGGRKLLVGILWADPSQRVLRAITGRREE